MAIVDCKVMTKAVKTAAAGLPERGKGKTEALMLTHFPASDGLCVQGYEGAEIGNTQTVPDCIATDEVAWRVPVSTVRLQKVLALKPKLMYAGYAEHSALSDRLIFEDSQAQMSVMLYHHVYEDLVDEMRKTDPEFAVCGSRGLHRCFDKDGWLLEQVETGNPSPALPMEGVKSERVKSEKYETVDVDVQLPPHREAGRGSTGTEAQASSFVEQLRAAIKARLAA